MNTSQQGAFQESQVDTSCLANPLLATCQCKDIPETNAKFEKSLSRRASKRSCSSLHKLLKVLAFRTGWDFKHLNWFMRTRMLKSIRSMQSWLELCLETLRSKSLFLNIVSRALESLAEFNLEFLATPSKPYKRLETFTNQSGAGAVCQAKDRGPEGGGSTKLSKSLVPLYCKKLTKLVTSDVTVMVGSDVNLKRVACLDFCCSFATTILSCTTASKLSMVQKNQLWNWRAHLQKCFKSQSG